MEKPSVILNRVLEWRELTRVWDTPRPELTIVLGRRRVGKSYLLSRFAQATGGIYYQATKRTESEQLLRLSTIVGEHFGDAALKHGVPFPDWESLFGYVSERVQGDPFLFVLDEFPYLVSSAPALPSILQALWDHRWSDTRMKLVLSGSHITAMRQLESADQPLYGRRTARVDLEPFDYCDAGRFLSEYSARDRLRAYGIFGGLPGHLSLLDASADLKTNVADQMLRPSGRLLDEAQHMLDAFLADAEVHYSVIDAVAAGEHTWQGITRRVGRVGGSVGRAVQWLLGMRLLERAVPITEANPDRSKRALYRITDPYLAFWHRFVSPMVSAGMVGLAPGDRLWESRIEPRLDDHMGAVFESVCRQFVRRGNGLPFEPLRVGEWWDAGSTNQIDVVAVGGNGELLLGECKWGTAGAADLQKLRARADLIMRELGGVREVWFALFSANAKHPVSTTASDRVLHFSPDDLYAT